MFCQMGAEREGGLKGKQQTLNMHKDMAIKFQAFSISFYGEDQVYQNPTPATSYMRLSMRSIENISNEIHKQISRSHYGAHLGTEI